MNTWNLGTPTQFYWNRIKAAAKEYNVTIREAVEYSPPRSDCDTVYWGLVEKHCEQGGTLPRVVCDRMGEAFRFFWKFHKASFPAGYVLPEIRRKPRFLAVK